MKAGRRENTTRTSGHIASYRDLRVYKGALDAAMRVFEITKAFPSDERFSLVDQVRRSSRSVCANIAEAWRKRRYEAHFVSKLSDAETEAEETRVWLQIAGLCGYIGSTVGSELDRTYDRVLGQLIAMISSPESWIIRRPGPPSPRPPISPSPRPEIIRP